MIKSDNANHFETFYSCYCVVLAELQYGKLATISNTQAIVNTCITIAEIFQVLLLSIIIDLTYIQNFRNMMDNLKVQGIFLSSISEISYANQQSQFGSYSIAQNKNEEKHPDYQIKINTPDNIYSEKEELIAKSLSDNGMMEDQVCPYRPPIEFNPHTTGYFLQKDTFSEEEILKAFNVIDINKDNMITEDDLKFILDYMNQQYTNEEIQEMIGMLSSDKIHVGFEEFKRLGRGDIIPLAKYKPGGNNIKQKTAILGNLEKLNMMEEQPEFLAECLKKQVISYKKFQQSKKNSKNNTFSKLQTGNKLNLVNLVALLPPSEHKSRKKLFNSIVVISTSNLLHNYLEFKNKKLNIQKISSLLELSIKEVKQIYPNSNQTDSLSIVLETVALSNQPFSKKLEICLDILNNLTVVTCEQLSHIIQMIKGKDESIWKKLKAILNWKGMEVGKAIQKKLAFEITLQFYNKLFGID